MKTSKKYSSDSKRVVSKFFIKNIILSLLTGLVLFIPGQNVYTTEELFFKLRLENGVILPTIVPAPVPTNFTGIFPGDEISASSVIVKDIDSGIFLYRRNAELRLSPASTTKILTALVALDNFSLDQIIIVKNVIQEGQVMGLVEGEQITLENLLYGLLIHSGNDAAYAIADSYKGGLTGFVEKMNQKAQELHLVSSNFTNPAGFDDINHKVNALDLTKIAIAALRNPVISKMVAIPSITISDITYTHFHRLTNVNELLGRIPGVGGIKTGWTEEAGENLITLVERQGHKLIIVVLHSQNRFIDTENLINWIFLNHSWKNVIPRYSH